MKRVLQQTNPSSKMFEQRTSLFFICLSSRVQEGGAVHLNPGKLCCFGPSSQLIHATAHHHHHRATACHTQGARSALVNLMCEKHIYLWLGTSLFVNLQLQTAMSQIAYGHQN